MSVIVLAGLGLLPAASPSDASIALDFVRDVERGRDTSVSSPTFFPTLQAGLEHLGATVSPIPAEVEAIAASVESCALVVVSGSPGGAWGRELDACDGYLHDYDDSSSFHDFDHWVAVIGATNDNCFLVADPLAAAGVIAVSSSQMARYIADAHLGRVAAAVSTR